MPVAGPVPPPSIEVTPDMSASSICCGQMKWMCESKPPAVRILPSPAITSVPGPTMMVTPGWMSGLPALPIAAMSPSFRPTSAFTIPQWSRMTALVMTVSTAPRALRRLRLPHAVADHLAAAELHLFAVGGEVLLDLDDELRVGEADPVAGRGAEHFGVMRAGEGGRGERVTGWGHRENSRHGGRRQDESRARAIEGRGRRRIRVRR